MCGSFLVPGLLARQRLVEIQDRQADRRERGVFGRVQVLVALRFADGQERPCRRVVPRTLSGMSFPASSRILGFGSKRSTCDGPPPCHRTTTRFAFGAKCGSPGWPGSPFGRSESEPRAVSLPTSAASAAMPTPLAAEPKSWRRVTRAIFSR